MNSNFSDEFDRYNHLISELDAVYHSASVKLGLSDSALQILYQRRAVPARRYAPLDRHEQADRQFLASQSGGGGRFARYGRRRAKENALFNGARQRACRAHRAQASKRGALDLRFLA